MSDKQTINQTAEVVMDEPISLEDIKPSLGQQQTRALAQVGPRDSSGAALLLLAMEQNRDLATIERMIAIRDQEEAKIAKKEFDFHFAIMQGDFKPVKRNKTARDDTKGRDLYDYAPIESLVATNGAAIARNGFSYSFREESISEEKKRRFFLIITGWGHTKETFVDLPEDSGKAPLMNGAQQARSLAKYGQRYAMEAGFGMVMEDEDDDAQSLTFDLGVQYSEEIKLLRESKTIPELNANYRIVYADKPDEAKKMFLMVRRDCESNIRKQESAT